MGRRGWMNEYGDVAERLRDARERSNNEEISILFKSFRSLFIYSPTRGDKSVRENFSPFLLLRFSPSVHGFLPVGKRCPSTLNSAVRLVTLARFLRSSSSQTFWTASRSFPLIFRIGIPSPTLMVAAAARRIEVVSREKEKERKREREREREREKKKDAPGERNSELLVSKTRFS